MANIEEQFDEITNFNCLIIIGVFLFVGFLFVVGLMMAVMVFPLALQPHIREVHWAAKIGKLIKIKSQKLLNCYCDYHNYPGNGLLFLMFLVQNLSFQLVQFSLQRLIYYFASILSVERSSQIVLCTFPRVFFPVFVMLAILSSPLFPWLKQTALCTMS